MKPIQFVDYSKSMLIRKQSAAQENDIKPSYAKVSNKVLNEKFNIYKTMNYTPINFCGKNFVKSSFKPFDEALYNYSAFTKKAQQSGLSSSKDYLQNCTEENIIGTGQNSKVYKFFSPLMDNWVIKVETKHNDYLDSFLKDLQPVTDEFTGYNLGQAIASIGNRVQILKKINGKPHSIKDWSNQRRSKIPITEDDAKSFLDDIKKIAQFPQRTFDEYAQKLKMLDDRGYKADSFNPNNYIIDYNKQQICIIDFYKYDVDAHLNTKYDLICPLVDYPNFERYYNVMDDAQKKEYIITTQILAKKCVEAAKKAGVNTSEDTFRDFIGRIDIRENNNSMYTNSFNTMKEICKNIEL